MVAALGARARPSLNRNEFGSRPASRHRVLPGPSFHARITPGPVAARAPCNRHEYAARPALGRTPVVVSSPWHVRYPIFSRPVVVLTGSWTPAVSLALGILGIGVLASLCFPEAAPVIMPMSIVLAITLLFLKAVAGRR